MRGRRHFLGVRLSDEEYEKYQNLLRDHLSVDPGKEYSKAESFRMLIDVLTDPEADLSQYGTWRPYMRRFLRSR